MILKLINPVWWFSFFGVVFRWWVACELFSIAVLPICFIIFRIMKDRGYGFAKIFGILFVTWLNWYLCIFLKFSFGSVLVAFALALGFGAFCFFFVKDAVLSFVKRRWRLIILYEVLFLFSFLFFANVRSYSPEAIFDPGYSGAEKLSNCNYLHDLMRVEHFPPYDTWLCGKDPRTNKPFYINYYYFGHLEWATIAKFSFYEANYAFNLGLATIFALTFIGAFALGFNLTRRLKWGLLAAFMVALFGNIDPLQQVIERMGYWLSHVPATWTVWKVLGGYSREIIWSVDFWRSSRIMDNTVTEFPYFSAILGDLHPHHSDLPIVLLALGTAMSLTFRMGRRTISASEVLKYYLPAFLFFAMVLGGAFATNSWDAIVLGFFTATIIFFSTLRWWGTTLRGFITGALVVAGLGVTAIVLFILFKLFFTAPLKNDIRIASYFPLKFEKLKLVVMPLPPNLRTDLSDYFVLFGLFLFPLILYLGGLFRRYLRKAEPAIRGLLILLFVFFLIFSLNAYHYWLPGLTLIWLLLSAVLLVNGRLGRRTDYFLLLGITVAFFTLFVEVFFIDDRMVGQLERYNTLFKIYYPFWGFLALAATYSFSRMFQIVLETRRWNRLVLLSLFLAVTIAVGMLYPIQATGVRTGYFFSPSEDMSRRVTKTRTLDATAYMHGDTTYSVDFGGMKKTGISLKDDAAIIDWIRKNVKGRPVILETIGGCYGPFARISSMTGLPTLVGWSHHVAQHRGDEIYKVTGPRETDANEIYTSSNTERCRELLKKYDVRYVMVGALERAKYKPEQLEKFGKFLKPVATEGTSVLYYVPQE